MPLTAYSTDGTESIRTLAPKRAAVRAGTPSRNGPGLGLGPSPGTTASAGASGARLKLPSTLVSLNRHLHPGTICKYVKGPILC